MAKTPNKRLAQPGSGGNYALRIYHRAAQGKMLPRYLIKCGCCDEQVEIYYDRDALEINGVNGSLADWREVLLPLLCPDGLP